MKLCAEPIVGLIALIAVSNAALAEDPKTLQELAADGYELKATNIAGNPFDMRVVVESLYLQKGSSIFVCSANLKKLFRPETLNPQDAYSCAELTK